MFVTQATMAHNGATFDSCCCWKIFKFLIFFKKEATIELHWGNLNRCSCCSFLSSNRQEQVTIFCISEASKMLSWDFETGGRRRNRRFSKVGTASHIDHQPPISREGGGKAKDKLSSCCDVGDNRRLFAISPESSTADWCSWGL